MHSRTLRILALATLASTSLPTGAASAQGNPEDGAVWMPPPDDTGTSEVGGTADSTTPSTSSAETSSNGSAWYRERTAPDTERPPAMQQQSTQSSRGSAGPASNEGPSTVEQVPTDSRDDHERVVNRLAVGYMGVTNVPIGTAGAPGVPPTVDTVAAPALGIRYWLGDLVGIDIGLGFGFRGGNTNDGVRQQLVDNAFAFLIHGGVPIAVFHEKHYKFLIIPEVNLGFSTGTYFGNNPIDDRGRNGVQLQVGGRLGTEIHFGFMDIPQLSLQASVGLYFEYLNVVVTGNRNGTPPDVSATNWSFATSVQGEPWDILLGSLTALYYF